VFSQQTVRVGFGIQRNGKLYIQCTLYLKYTFILCSKIENTRGKEMRRKELSACHVKLMLRADNFYPTKELNFCQFFFFFSIDCVRQVLAKRTLADNNLLGLSK
jgi:hypothetical protein